jgi:hypothetical protein
VTGVQTCALPISDVDLYIGQNIYVYHGGVSTNTFTLKRTANISIGGSGQFIVSSSPATTTVQTMARYKTAMATWINCNSSFSPHWLLQYT